MSLGQIPSLSNVGLSILRRAGLAAATPATFLRGVQGRALGMAAAATILATAQVGSAQTWTRLAHNPPAGINLMLQLSDGTVIAANNNGSTIGNAWYRLTPDIHGSYVNGTWTSIASAHDTRLYYASVVLRDGRVFVAGGEYGTGGSRAEVYDPTTNVWTQMPVPTSLLNPAQSSPVTGGAQAFVDSNCEIIANGNVLICPVSPRTAGQTLLFNPTTNTWSAGPNLFRGNYQDEASWVKLPDQSILTIDPFGTNSERYIPASNTWINDGVVPVSLYDPFGLELGAALLVPDGRAFYLGSTGQTAFYTPSGSTAQGVWHAGPVIPSSQGTPDAPAAMMVNGHILCAVSPVPTSANHFPTPTRYYEFDPVAGTYTLLANPSGSTDPDPTYKHAMLDTADGNVLLSHFATDVYSFHPSGSAQAPWKPLPLSVSANADGSYHLTGTQLNGISEGAGYGDDLQMNTNYPLVRLTDGSANVYFARTFNWSSTGVATGNQVVSTEYTLPATLPAGQYTLAVIANGIASDSCTPPSIDSGPTTQTSCTGSSATFSVSVSGPGSFTYVWRRGTTVLTDGGNISGTNTNSLTINPVSAADAGTNYNVIVTSTCGVSLSNQAQLVVSDPCQTCYPNCDQSTTQPILNVNDFSCFINRFAAGDAYANCDGSTTPPVLNVNDFSCFINAFAAGCR